MKFVGLQVILQNGRLLSFFIIILLRFLSILKRFPSKTYAVLTSGITNMTCFHCFIHDFCFFDNAFLALVYTYAVLRNRQKFE